jgi:hypothetical protein
LLIPSPWPNHPNILRRVHIKKFPIMQFPLVLILLSLSLMFKYSHHPFLIHPSVLVSLKVGVHVHPRQAIQLLFYGCEGIMSNKLINHFNFQATSIWQS